MDVNNHTDTNTPHVLIDIVDDDDEYHVYHTDNNTGELRLIRKVKLKERERERE